MLGFSFVKIKLINFLVIFLEVFVTLIVAFKENASIGVAQDWTFKSLTWGYRVYIILQWKRNTQ